MWWLHIRWKLTTTSSTHLDFGNCRYSTPAPLMILRKEKKLFLIHLTKLMTTMSMSIKPFEVLTIDFLQSFS